MKIVRILSLLLSAWILAANVSGAETDHKKHGAGRASQSKGKLVSVTEKDAAWLAKAREAYPLKTCIASGDALGSMGENAEFIYREEGKPDRLVVFCCKGCDEDFMADPAKHLAKIDAAAKGKADGPKSNQHGHKGHH